MKRIGDSVDEFFECHRLIDERRNTQGMATIDLLWRIRRGHEDYGEVPETFVGPDSCQKLNSCQGREFKIEEDSHELLGFMLLVCEVSECRSPVSDHLNLGMEVSLCELSHQQLLIVRVVFDNQDSSGKIFHGSHVPMAKL
jgi:hypothetical protein